MEKLYLFNVYTYCKSLCVINVGSPYMVYHGDTIYISYLYDQMWLVGLIIGLIEEKHAVKLAEKLIILQLLKCIGKPR